MRLSLKTNSANPDPAPSPQDDQRWMRAALALARRGEGRTCPNPAVGCVIVRNGCLMGRGWTRPGGRPHAETVALNDAGGTAAGATAYVTLEPCSHHGKTPPCADALISAGISRVVVAITDPDDRVSGQGIERLKAAGIAVTTGVLGDEVGEDNFGSLNKGGIRLLVELEQEMAGFSPSFFMSHFNGSFWRNHPRIKAAITFPWPPSPGMRIPRYQSSSRHRTTEPPQSPM